MFLFRVVENMKKVDTSLCRLGKLKELSTPKWNWSCFWLCTEWPTKLLDLANPGLLYLLHSVISTIRLRFSSSVWTLQPKSFPLQAPPFCSFLDLGRQGHRQDHLHSGMEDVIGVFWRLSSMLLSLFHFSMQQLEIKG
jgi:hypothetical protein